MDGERERVVLVMTDIIDPTADRVVAELDRRGASVFRCNPGDFPQLLTLAAHIDQSATDGLLRLHDREGNPLRDVRLGDVGCGYYRRPTAFRIPDDMPESWQWWAAREARQGFGGVIATLPRCHAGSTIPPRSHARSTNQSSSPKPPPAACESPARW